MSKRYFTLITRANSASPWDIEFGDYSRAVVKAERDDLAYSLELRASNCRIITSGATQTEIDAAVRTLNSDAGVV